MPDRLSAAVALLAAHTPALSRQMFEAALYLVDLEIFHRTGKTLSGGIWRRRGDWPEVEGFIATLDELALAGDIERSIADVRWLGSTRRAHSPSVRDGLALVVDLVARCDHTNLVAVVGNTSPFLLTEGAPSGSALPFESNPRVPPRVPRASAAERATFKRRELARVADLVEIAIERD